MDERHSISIGRILLLSFVVLLSSYSFGQGTVKSKKGYIGISFGPTIFTGSNYEAGWIVPGYPDGSIALLESGDVGLTINFLDAGYILWRNWGVSLKWQGGAHVYKNSNEEFAGSFGSIMIGPVYSIELNEKMSLDFKARVGRMYMGSKYESHSGGTIVKPTNDYVNIGIEAGSSFRYHFARKWSWINNLEFQNHFSDHRLRKISRVNLTTGIGFRF